LSSYVGARGVTDWEVVSIEYRWAIAQGALSYMVFRRLSRSLLVMCFLEDRPEPIADEAKDVGVTGVVVTEAEES
jgi:hypothetical protein